MILTFKKITLHNFGSYSHAEIPLENKGFCLVSGKNNCTTDNATSNGSGKSFWGSAICYTITGETINGLKNNLKNINSIEDNCYTELEFSVDNDQYLLTRYHKPKSDLKIIKNGADISGKGVRESEQKLASILPDLNKDLIASTILLGQGLPNKFSSFSPSGRKEMLEKLTKSDYMIEDIKGRISQRFNELNQQIRVQEDSLLIQTTQQNLNKNTLAQVEQDIAGYTPKDYQADIDAQTKILEELNCRATSCAVELTKITAEQDAVNKALIDITTQKANTNNAELQSYMTAINEKANSCNKKEAELNMKKAELARLEAIKDVCPTCGQKLVGVTKPDTTEAKVVIAKLQAEIEELKQAQEAIRKQHQEYLKKIDAEFDADITAQQNKLAEVKQQQTMLQKQNTELLMQQQSIQTKLDQIKYNQLNDQKIFDSWVAKKQELQNALTQNDKLINLCKEAKADLTAHLDVVKKIETLIKRDFRGYLLSNVINFIDKKAKEYAQVVFNNANLNIYLDGNALEITYCDKYFDSLSGGEKQRIDLILQFAIRDMLSTYLNYSANIIVLDEVFDNLDKVATDKILTLITEKLKDIDSIFIISHHIDTLNIGYDSELTIVKNQQGISEVFN